MKSFNALLVSILITLTVPGSVTCQDVRSLLDRSTKFTAGGKVFEDDLYGFPTYHEDGVLNGVAYRIYYLDGSGTFEGVKGNGVGAKTIAERSIDDEKKNWNILCREDAVDIFGCFVGNYSLAVFRDTKGNQFVAVRGHDDPRGATVSVTLDDSLNFTDARDTQFLGATAAKIVERLKTAKQVTTTFRAAKDRPATTTKFEVYGFVEALTYLDWLISTCRKTYDARKGSRPDILGGGYQTCNKK